MAANKECLIVILDVRQNSKVDFRRNAIKCVADILKEKICLGKKDFVSFVLLGTQRTCNDSNANVCNDGYLNIVQYPQTLIPTWNLLVEFMKFINEPSCNDGEWLDALVVAMELLKSSEEFFKFQRQRILLFHDFDSPDMSYDMFDVITDNISKIGIELIVVSSNIQYIDNAANGEPQAVFRHSPTKHDYQMVNEKYALRLVTNCSAKLVNFHNAFHTITLVENKRPWCWNSQLSIGSKITIKISGVIAVKDESQIKLKKCWGAPDEQVTRHVKSFAHGAEVQPLDIDLIDGYMLGSTPIAFDETLQEPMEQLEPGLSFIGFLRRNSIPDEYYCGDSLYWVVHQKKMNASAKKLDALVKALLATEMAVLCWKVFSVKFNNPKIVVLLPNKLHDDRPASLSMVELSYHAQHHYWDFPTLRTHKTECTAAQLDAIDNLIDSMDLLLSPKAEEQPRETPQKDLLPINMLPHVFETCLLDMLERKVLCVAGEDDPYIKELVAEKDYKEIFWQVPEAIEQRAKNAANKVKKLFPLEANAVASVKVKTEPSAENNNNNNENEKNNKVEPKALARKLERVGSITPADDFEMLLKQEVLTLQDNTARDARFHLYATQMRATIWQLLFKTTPMPALKIAEALRVFRKCCYDFNAFSEYNTWMRQLKSEVENQKLFDFWQNHVVKGELGLCTIGELSLEEKLDLAEFYKIDADHMLEMTSEDDEMNDTSVDELLASI